MLMVHIRLHSRYSGDMNERIDKTPAASYRTDVLRKQAMVRIALFEEFCRRHPNMKFDEDQELDDQQAAEWDEMTRKAFGD